MKSITLKIKKMLGLIKGGQDGGALVETALTFPVLIIMIAGVTEFSRVAYASLEVVSAAKAGVSYGSQTGGTATDLTAITYAAQHDAANVSSLKVLSATSSYACSNPSDDPAGGANTGGPASALLQTLTVVTQATIDPIIHVPGLPTTYTINGQASQLCVQ